MSSPAGTNYFTPVTTTLNIGLTDVNGLAMFAECTGTPPTTAGIFQHGCIINQTDTTTGNPALYENVGSSAVPSWTLFGSSSPGTIALASAHVLVGNGSNVATDVAMTGDITIANTGATAIGAGKVLKAMLGTGISASHIVKFAGKHTTTGGNASEAFTVSGVASTDIVFVTMQTVGISPVTIVTAAPTTNTITIVFDADPSTDHIVAYQVLRATT